jgi:hypothetical protein
MDLGAWALQSFERAVLLIKRRIFVQEGATGLYSRKGICIFSTAVHVLVEGW